MAFMFLKGCKEKKKSKKPTATKQNKQQRYMWPLSEKFAILICWPFLLEEVNKMPVGQSGAAWFL